MESSFAELKLVTIGFDLLFGPFPPPSPKLSNILGERVCNPIPLGPGKPKIAQSDRVNIKDLFVL